MKNIPAMWSSLSRAYQVALLGNYSISLFYSPDYITGEYDCNLIKEYYHKVKFVTDGDFKIEIVWDSNSYTYSDGVTEQMLNEWVEIARTYSKPTEYESKDSYDQLKKIAFQKLNIPLNRWDMADEVAAVIAQLAGNDFIESIHLAETIQYIWANPDGQIQFGDNKIYFGNGIAITKNIHDEGDIDAAIEYLQKLKNENYN